MKRWTIVPADGGGYELLIGYVTAYSYTDVFQVDLSIHIDNIIPEKIMYILSTQNMDSTIDEVKTRTENIL